MVKRKTVRQKIGKKETKKQDTRATSPSSQDLEQGSSIHNLRLKRKLTKQIKFLSKLQDTESALGAKKVISKKRRRKKSALNNLSTLGDVLPSFPKKSVAEKSSELPRRKQSRARQHLVVIEAQQLSKVLHHPQFKSNPFAAIHQHLVNTVSPVPVNPTKPLSKDKAKKRVRQKKKNRDMEE